ncbi:MAG TPA: hypothetical protein PKZ42_01190 [Syntrophales bacterium]|nr:hypothetical protein [Syntrophales bacterium]
MKQLQPQLTICKRCILPGTFPGIRFDEEGICNHCRREEKSATNIRDTKEEYRRKFDALISEIRGTAPTYDVIMAYSGGKDSSYTLKLLRERYDLRILALTFDNHFISPLAFKNIEKITDSLEIDHLNVKPYWPVMKSIFNTAEREEIFPKAALLRASSICTACISMVKSITLKTALEMSIPLVAFGWSPGQAPLHASIMKTNPSMTHTNQKAVRNIFEEKIGYQALSYFIPDTYYESYKERFPYNIHPLAFFDYNEEQITRELGDMGWVHPSDTDSNSTNCLINAYANQCHLEQYGFHPYVYEIANMVRQGVMTREEGMEKIYSEQNREMVSYARKKLRIQGCN